MPFYPLSWHVIQMYVLIHIIPTHTPAIAFRSWLSKNIINNECQWASLTKYARGNTFVYRCALWYKKAKKIKMYICISFLIVAEFWIYLTQKYLDWSDGYIAFSEIDYLFTYIQTIYCNILVKSLIGLRHEWKSCLVLISKRVKNILGASLS